MFRLPKTTILSGIGERQVHCTLPNRSVDTAAYERLSSRPFAGGARLGSEPKRQGVVVDTNRSLQGATNGGNYSRLFLLRPTPPDCLQRFKPGDTHCSGADAKRDVIGMKRAEVKQRLEKRHVQDESKKDERAAYYPPHGRIWRSQNGEDGP